MSASLGTPGEPSLSRGHPLPLPRSSLPLLGHPCLSRGQPPASPAVIPASPVVIPPPFPPESIDPLLYVYLVQSIRID